MEKEKEITEQKITDIQEIIKIVGDNMENQIEVFKNDKTQNYYKYLKIFAIMQRESNRVIRELWTLVKNALNEIVPNAGQDNNDYPQKLKLKMNNNIKNKKKIRHMKNHRNKMKYMKMNKKILIVKNIRKNNLHKKVKEERQKNKLI